MMKYTIPILLFLTTCSTPPQNSILILVENEEGEMSYVNEAEKTIIPFGTYTMAFTDSITQIGFVYKNEVGFLAIDTQGKELFEVFAYDNGPDYVADGLFRIVENDLIGYANEDGTIVIPPKFACAYPFENGKAKVAMDCKTEQIGEHSSWISENWFWIDKAGNIVE